MNLKRVLLDLLRVEQLKELGTELVIEVAVRSPIRLAPGHQAGEFHPGPGVGDVSTGSLGQYAPTALLVCLATQAAAGFVVVVTLCRLPFRF